MRLWSFASWFIFATLFLTLLSCGRIGFRQLPVDTDECPEDDQKVLPGLCGCGSVDADSDGDGTVDCLDDCPTDPTKTDPSVCDCNIPDIDNDGFCETWALPLWSYRIPIIIGSRVPQAVLSDFPTLVDIQNNDSLRNEARSDGHDIRFTTEDGELLEHELESYEALTGSLLAWVKLPSFDTSVDTLILLYYGNDNSDTNPSVTRVWDNGYLGVWHLGESGTGAADEFYDSSGSGNHASGGGGNGEQTPTTISGKFGSAQAGDGIDDFISTPLRLSGQQAFTVTAWFSVRSVDNTPRPGLFGQNNALEIGFYWVDCLNVWTPNTVTHCPGKNIPSACTADFLFDTWTHFAVVFDGENAILYLNGEEKHVAESTGLGSSTSFFNLMGRTFDANGNSLDGMLDEVRVANVNRSPAWIVTQYAVQSDPNSFYDIGDMQQAP